MAHAALPLMMMMIERERAASVPTFRRRRKSAARRRSKRASGQPRRQSPLESASVQITHAATEPYRPAAAVVVVGSRSLKGKRPLDGTYRPTSEQGCK